MLPCGEVMGSIRSKRGEQGNPRAPGRQCLPLECRRKLNFAEELVFPLFARKPISFPFEERIGLLMTQNGANACEKVDCLERNGGGEEQYIADRGEGKVENGEKPFGKARAIFFFNNTGIIRGSG